MNLKTLIKHKLSLTATLISILSIAITTGCSTYSPQTSSSSTADNNVKYGSGEGNTKPYPQTAPVEISNLAGAKITNEPYSAVGNKDYVVLGKEYKVWRDVSSYIEEGTASWYGPGFNGQKTSNGEKYDMNGFSAAHKNLPLPSFLKVTNLNNGKAAIVRVNDRGPFHSNRIIDLSKGAAQYLGVIGPGTAKVRIELLKTVPDGKQTSIEVMNGYKPFIQVFTTSDYSKAVEIKNIIAQNVSSNVYIERIKSSFRIKVGPIASKDNAKTLKTIKSLGYPKAFTTNK